MTHEICHGNPVPSLEEAKYGDGVKTLNGSQPSDYFNIWSPNKDIKKQYKKPSFIPTQKAHTMNNMNYNINMDSTVPRSMDTGVSWLLVRKVKSYY